MNNPGLEIRRYRAGDHAEVWELHSFALWEAGADAGRGPWDEDLGRIEQEYLESGGEFLVGHLDGRLVAMGALKAESSGRAEIRRMRVHPECQRRGFGRAILDALEARAADLGYSELFLHTTTVQLAAQELYRQNGFEETDRGTIGPFDVIYFEKRI